MDWLKEILEKKLKALSKEEFVDRSFGFDDIRRVVAIAEKALEQNAADTMSAQHEAAMKAAADPNHDWMENPVFVPMGKELRKAHFLLSDTLRASLMITVYSHAEHLLWSWCRSVTTKPEEVAKVLKKKDAGESDPDRCLRFLRDEIGFDTSRSGPSGKRWTGTAARGTRSLTAEG